MFLGHSSAQNFCVVTKKKNINVSSHSTMQWHELVPCHRHTQQSTVRVLSDNLVAACASTNGRKPRNRPISTTGLQDHTHVTSCRDYFSLFSRQRPWRWCPSWPGPRQMGRMIARRPQGPLLHTMMTSQHGDASCVTWLFVRDSIGNIVIRSFDVFLMIFCHRE